MAAYHTCPNVHLSLSTQTFRYLGLDNSCLGGKQITTLRLGRRCGGVISSFTRWEGVGRHILKNWTSFGLLARCKECRSRGGIKQQGPFVPSRITAFVDKIASVAASIYYRRRAAKVPIVYPRPLLNLNLMEDPFLHPNFAWRLIS